MAFSSVFDCLLFRPQTHEDIEQYQSVQKVLREEIVNPLRTNFFVRADRVMKLRKLLDTLTSVRGLTSEEKGGWKRLRIFKQFLSFFYFLFF